LRNVLANTKGCSNNDFRAVQVDNPFENTIQVQNVLSTIGAFVWVIGIATLLAGIVGVSNIMLITVKERTRELGVRKAMGASNTSIIRLVLLESVIITMLFGYVGLMAGIGLTQLLDRALGTVFPMFQNPTVQFIPIIICNLVMIMAGLVAGYVPAKRATTIKLVEALTS
jgi:putative ABC transport system permease protein